MTKDQLRDRLTSAANLLDVFKGFIPGDADDRFVEYVRAVAQSDALLTLIAEDLTNVGLPLAAVDQLKMVSLAADGSTVEEAIGDGTILRLLLQLLSQLNELFKNFPFARA